MYDDWFWQWLGQLADVSYNVTNISWVYGVNFNMDYWGQDRGTL